MLHYFLSDEQIHSIIAFTYADAATRAAATGFEVAQNSVTVTVPFSALDVGKIALQSDEGSYWMLTNHSPVTWVEMLVNPLKNELSAGANTIGFTLTDNGNSGTAKTIDFRTGNKQLLTLTDNCTLTFTAPSYVCNLMLKIIVGGSGNYTITWPAAVKWAGGSAPSISTTVGYVDLVSLFFDGTNYYGEHGADYQ
jgi:hypothetical protein